MARYALIQSGLVNNICEWDGNPQTWAPPEGVSAIIAPDHVGIGWSYDGENWSAPQARAQTFNGSTLDFMRLFTAQEVISWNAAKAAVAAMTPQDYADPNQAAMATFSYFNALFAETNTIDTSRADLQAGLDVLIAIGVIASERKAQIIAGVAP